MNVHRVAVLPGDGIGQEVIPAALTVLNRVSEVTGTFRLETTLLPWGCEYFLAEGRMMPEDGLAVLAEHDAIFLGAVGFPGVADHVSLTGLLIPIRQGFDQYVNLRPIRLLPGIESPLRRGSPETIDFLCIRENTEGEYSGLGGRFRESRQEEVAFQVAVFTRRGIDRVARYAFECARSRRLQVASATKSNALQYSAVLWDEVVAEVSSDYPDIGLTSYHVDALAARLISAPETLDVVVASNLFGDILTDIGAALQGSLGMAASANLNPTRKYPSMFEPVHGSAPDLAGQQLANPMGAIWSGALMLHHLGELEGSALVMRALESVAAAGPRTPDLGGQASTLETSMAVSQYVTDTWSSSDE